MTDAGPAGDGFGVDVDMLHDHARRLGTVVDSVALAADAARQVDLHDGAFGLLCAFLPPVLNDAETATGDAVDASRRALQRSADGVTDMALTYAAADEAAQRGVDTATGTG